jgi:hypothetical protein
MNSTPAIKKSAKVYDIGFTVGFSEQDLLVGLVASGVSDAVDMHDGYRL